MKTRNSHGLLQLGREALAYCQCASALILGNKALLVSVDLIGEKNQVILEYLILPEDHPGMEQPAIGDWVVQVNLGIQSLVDFHELTLFLSAFLFKILSLRTQRKWQSNQQDDCGH